MRSTIAAEMLVAGVSVGGSATAIAFQIIQDGASPSTGVQTGVLGSAVAVIAYLERRRRTEQEAAALERREADKHLHSEIEGLRKALANRDTEIKRLNGRIEELLERIIATLEDGHAP